MVLLLSIAVIASALSASAGILNNNFKPLTTSCRTLYGLTKVNSCKTKTSIGYTPCVKVTTYTTKVTSTCAASTSTVYTTKITNSTAPTSTLTATSTIFSTTTQTATLSSTVTSTTITDAVDTVTTTITSSTTPGFTPVRSSLPRAYYAGSGGSSPGSKRDAIDAPAVPMDKRTAATAKRRYYANKVDCIVYTASSVCSTQKFTATSTIRVSAPTSTLTKATTIVSVTYPSATTTVTITSLVTTMTTVTSTFTTTSTTTNLIAAPTQTFYQICAENNFADTDAGSLPLNAIFMTTRAYRYYLGSVATSAYDCCVQSYLRHAADELPGVWAYNPALEFRVNAEQNCNSYIRASGGSDSQAAGSASAYYGDIVQQAVVGNGYYGAVTNTALNPLVDQ